MADKLKISSLERVSTRREKMRDDEEVDYSDDDYDAARDAYLTGEGPPVTRKQIAEQEEWNEECRRNGW